MSLIAFNLKPDAPGDVAHNLPAEAYFQKGMSHHLIAEFGQNSWDASRLMMNGETAYLRVTLKLMPRAQMLPYDLEAAEKHAAECEGEMGDFEVAEFIPVLLVEDTSGGLEGEVTATDNATKTPLGRYLFEKGTGLHGKDGRSGGRFGLGSTVGSLVSALRVMYIHSMRKDGTTVGSARLAQPTHDFEGQQYSGDARLGYRQDDQWGGILKGDAADEMALAFGMSRPFDKPGLSCAIVYPMADFDFDSLVTGAVAMQFYQIAMGFIKIDIIDEINGRSVSFDRQGLEGFLASPAYDELLGVNRKPVQDALLRARSAFSLVTKLGEVEPRAIIPVGSKIAVSAADRKDFMGNRVIRVDTLQHAEHKHHDPVDGKFINYIAKLPDNAPNFHIQVRDGIAVTTKGIARGVASLTISADDDIANVVGDGENPSHTAWTLKQAKDRLWKQSASSVFSAFNNNATELHAAITGHEEETDRFSLAAWLPMPGNQSYSQGGSGPEADSEVSGETFEGTGISTDSIETACDHKTSTLLITLSKMSKDRIAERGPIHIQIIAEYHKAPKGSGDLYNSKGFFTVHRGAAEHKVEITPFGQMLTVRQASADLKVALKIDLIRDVKIRAEIVEPEADDEELEDAA